jgi:hypothetical protein
MVICCSKQSEQCQHSFFETCDNQISKQTPYVNFSKICHDCPKFNGKKPSGFQQNSIHKVY